MILETCDTDYFTGKRVLVMGLGRFGGGTDAAEFLHRCGATLTVTDMLAEDNLNDSIDRLRPFSDIEYHLGGHSESDFKKADIIVVNPAVRRENRFVNIAREHDKVITSQIEIFARLCPALAVGVTGSNGKSTTAALTAHLLKAGRADEAFRCKNVYLTGNIGNASMLRLLDTLNVNDIVVLELSSFQLLQLANIRWSPDIALITNVTANHLDYHGTFDEYCDAKENIFRYQQPGKLDKPVSIFNAEDPVSVSWFEKYKSETGRICLIYSPEDVAAGLKRNFRLPGRANLSNLAAASRIADCLSVNDDAISASLSDFKPLPHRLEFVTEHQGITWYNDSISTTPQSAIVALEAFDAPVILIAGGYDKQLEFDELGKAVAKRAKAAILIGQTAEKIKTAIEKHRSRDRCNVRIVSSLKDSIFTAKKMSAPGDIVILSPACASYDMFDNFQQRGNEFMRLVKTIHT